MVTPNASFPQAPILTAAVLHRALSQQRLAAYAQTSDRDEADSLARYLWNIALVSALQPSLHVFEVTLRNAIFTMSLKLVDTSRLDMPDVPCWLDARDSTLLYAREADEVARAKAYLDADPRRRTPGHLIAKLSFGFWVQLTARVYSEHRADGPRLWPRGLPHVFPFRWARDSKKEVPTHADREMVHNRLHQVRELRNRVAHYESLWDRDLVTQYAGMLELLGWMNPKMGEALRAFDPFPATHADGPEAYRWHAERLLIGGVDG